MRLTILVILGLFVCGITYLKSENSDILERVISRIHTNTLILDSHIDIPLNYAEQGGADPGAHGSALQGSLDAMESGGYGCAFLITYTPQGALDEKSTAEARRQFTDNRLDGIDRLLARYSNRVAKAVSPDEVESIHSSGRIAVAIGMENGYPIGGDLSLLDHYYSRGVRYITLTHNGHNLIADSCNPPNRPYPWDANVHPRELRLLRDLYMAEARAAGPPPPLHDGLSEFGRRVVAEMNKLGIMIDISHTGPATVEDVLAVSAAPVIASHSNSRALCDNPRNLTDEQLRAIAEKDGVIQVTAVPVFISDPIARRKELSKVLSEVGALEAGYDNLLALFENNRPEYDKLSSRYQTAIAAIDSTYSPPSLKDYVDHVDHVVRVAGIEHVGIGSDFDGGGRVGGFDSAADAPRLTAELVRRGYTEQQIAMIWSGNLMRVWLEVEKVSRRLSGN